MISATCVPSGAAAPQRSFRAGWLALVLALPAGCTDAPVVVPTGPDGALSREILPQAILEGASGTIAYIRYEPGAKDAWEIWCVDAQTEERTRAYTSRQEIESVAVNPTCTTLVFSMRASNSPRSDFDVYRRDLNQRGNSLSRSTKTRYDETNVSVSADGNIIVWEGEHEGERSLFGDINGDGTDDIIVATGPGRQPSVSSDGNFIAFVHPESGEYRVMLYDIRAGTSREVARSRSPLAHPSSSNGGAKVAYLEHDAEWDRVWVKDMNDGTTTAVVEASKEDPAAKVLNHPHLAPDGEFLVYVFVEPETDGVTPKIFAHGISNHFQAAIDAAVTPAGLFAPYWQTP